MYKVLLVDDEPMVRMGISTILKRHYTDLFICGEAADGKKAIELTLKYNPELVITDIRMPVMDGFEYVKYLHEFYRDTVVIVLTGFDDFLYAKEMIKYNIYSYILKPIDTDEFLDLIIKSKHEINNRKRNLSTNNFLNLHYDGVLAKAYMHLYDSNTLYFIHSRDNEGLAKSIFLAFNYLVENNFSYDHICLFSIEFANVIASELKLSDKQKGSFVDCMKRCSNIEELRRCLITYSTEMLASAYEEDKLTERTLKVIENIKKYVNDNLAGDLSLTNIGKKFHFNESYLSTLFKAITGGNFIDYVTRIRLEKAISYMDNDELLICEIAAKVGYSNQSYFCRLFMKTYGMTPKEYRDCKVRN